jgi:predicted RNA methylase
MRGAMFQAAMIELSEPDRALLALLDRLAARGYRFVTPTPATHARVIARRDHWEAHDLSGALGWSLPFNPAALDPEIVAALGDGGMLVEDGALVRSLVRVSSLGNRLFLHSAYPADGADAVFFGPDSYRFADFIRAELRAARRIVDIGAGSGVGAIVAADLCPAAEIVMTDVNEASLRLARINAAHAGIDAAFVHTDGVRDVEGGFDAALVNPPYILDPSDGGRAALDMAKAAAERLEPGGRLLLYTGIAITGGRDRLRDALREALAVRRCDLTYREIDPDVFGEVLEQPAYADVDRIAAVGAVAVKRA